MKRQVVDNEACSTYIFKFTDTLCRYYKFGSTTLQKRHKFFDSPVHMKVMLTILKSIKRATELCLKNIHTLI